MSAPLPPRPALTVQQLIDKLSRMPQGMKVSAMYGMRHESEIMHVEWTPVGVLLITDDYDGGDP